ncbi:hypothetical protein [Pseudomonas sp. GM21]
MLAAAVSGFLWWNFPPARIFMGTRGVVFLVSLWVFWRFKLCGANLNCC